MTSQFYSKDQQGVNRSQNVNPGAEGGSMEDAVMQELLLGGEVHALRILREFEGVRHDVRDAIARVQGRLQALMQAEIQRAFEDALRQVWHAPQGPDQGPTGQRPSRETQAAPSWNSSFGQPYRMDGQGQQGQWRNEAAEEVAQSNAEPPPRRPSPVLSVVRPLAPSAHATLARDSEAEEEPEELLEGAIRLRVEAGGYMSDMAHFISELWQKPQVRLLRVIGNQRQNAAEVWLELRKPLSLKKLLQQMDGVGRVTTAGLQSQSGARLFSVTLAGHARAS